MRGRVVRRRAQARFSHKPSSWQGSATPAGEEGQPGAAVTAYLEVRAADRRELGSCISAVLEAVRGHGISRASETTIIAIRADQPQFDLAAGDESDR